MQLTQKSGLHFRTLALIYAVIWLPLSVYFTYQIWDSIPALGFVNELTVSQAVYADSPKIRDLLVYPIFAAFGLGGLIVSWAIAHFLNSKSSQNIIQNTPQQLALRDTYTKVFFGLCLFIAGLIAGIPAIALLMMAVSLLVLSWCCPNTYEIALQHAVLFATSVAILANNILQIPFDNALAFGFFLFSVLLYVLPHRVMVLKLSTLFSAAVICTTILLMAPMHWRVTETKSNFTVLDFLFIVFALLVFVLSTKKTIFELIKKQVGSVTTPLTMLLGIALAIWSTLDISIPILPIDDYHFGEKLTAADALLKTHTLFLELMPAHGFSDAMPGFIAYLSGDISASGSLWGTLIMLFLFKIALAILILTIIRNKLLAIALWVFIPPLPLGIIEPATFLALIVATTRLKNQYLAGAIATLAAAAAIFFNGGIGIATAVGGYAIIAVYSLMASDGKAKKQFFIATIVTGLAFAIVTFPFTWNWLNYLLQSTKANLTIFGSVAPEWFPKGEFADPAVKEWVEIGHSLVVVLRHIFIGLPFLAAAILMGSTRRLGKLENNFLITVLMIAPLILLGFLLNSYSMGRIDDGHPRAIAGSLMSIMGVICWTAIFTNKSQQLMLLGCVSFVLALLFNTPSSHLKPIFQTHEKASHIPQGSAPLGWQPTALPPASYPNFRLGNGGFSDQHIQNINAISKGLAFLELPNDKKLTIANLTNRSALSYYLDFPVNGLITSAYNSAPLAFQMQTIERWKHSPPDVFIVNSYNQEHDGYILSLRSHLFYRYLLENYRPVQINGVVFGIRKDTTFAHQQWSSNSQTIIPIANYTDANWTNGIAAAGQGKGRLFFIDSIEIAAKIKVGDEAKFSDGISRKITSVDGRNIGVDGEILPDTGAPLTFTIEDLKIDNGSNTLLSIANHTDVNWNKGIAVSGQEKGRLFFIDSEEIAAKLNIDDKIVFGDGKQRHIKSINGKMILIDGDFLPNSDYPHSFIVEGLNIDDHFFWKSIFELPDLGKIPGAWGRSFKHLADDVEKNSILDLEVLPENSNITQLEYDRNWTLKNHSPIDPLKYGLLKLNIHCETELKNIPVQIFWNTETKPFNENDSIRYLLSGETNLIPLDASPKWLLNDPITSLRVDVGNQNGYCDTVSISSPQLMQRVTQEQ